MNDFLLEYKNTITFSIEILSDVTALLLYKKYKLTVADWKFVNLKRLIFLFANIFMYSCFTIGLIISKPMND